jgi:chaperonin GroEL (HSP60 family)
LLHTSLQPKYKGLEQFANVLMNVLSHEKAGNVLIALIDDMKDPKKDWGQRKYTLKKFVKMLRGGVLNLRPGGAGFAVTENLEIIGDIKLNDRADIIVMGVRYVCTSGCCLVCWFDSGEGVQQTQSHANTNMGAHKLYQPQIHPTPHPAPAVSPHFPIPIHKPAARRRRLS